MLGGSFERKSSSEDRKPINMENSNWRTILEACKAKKQFQVCYHHSSVQSVESSPQYVCLLVLQHQGKWTSFLPELMTLTEAYYSVWNAIATFRDGPGRCGAKCET